MNPEIKSQWTAALRSGEYEQGKGYLRIEGDVPSYCCLGVLCDLAVKAGVVTAKEGTSSTLIDDSRYATVTGYVGDDKHTSTSFLPHAVQQWAGLGSSDGSFLSDEPESLVALNDNGATFDHIADVIETEF